MPSTAFLGYCPNCLLGKLFNGLMRPRASGAVCNMPFEYKSGTFTMTAFILYILICARLAIEGLTLGLVFAIFPGFRWVLNASALVLYLVLNCPQPVKPVETEPHAHDATEGPRTTRSHQQR